MWEWTGPAELAWLVWVGWWAWHRWHPEPPVVVGTPPSFRSAMLLNAHGTLDSVRTIAGDPPSEIATNRGTSQTALQSPRERPSCQQHAGRVGGAYRGCQRGLCLPRGGVDTGQHQRHSLGGCLDLIS